MATQKTKEQKLTRKEQKQERNVQKESKSYLPYLLGIGAIAIIVLLLYFIGTNYLSIPFSTFKSNFLSSPRVALTVGYSNTTQLAYLNPCFTNIIQFIAHNRNASTIDFFIINRANSTCLYSPTGLGGPISSIATQSASKCLAIANSEPSVFLNYSSSNSTQITYSHVYIFGNSAYLSKCPIAQSFG